MMTMTCFVRTATIVSAAMIAAMPGALFAQVTVQAPTPEAARVDAIVKSAPFAAARAKLASDYDRTIAELIRITETPAPPFKEAVRAKLYADMFRAQGLQDVTVDAEGNVTGIRRGTGPANAAGVRGKMLVVSAHLDTVFPEGTPIKVRRIGTQLHAPGIGDDSLGLSSILAWSRALDAGKVRTRDDILFMGTVGEEGAGDLRGVRHFFAKGVYKDRVGAFFSVDGTRVARIVNAAVGSRRYRVTFNGPGGHSYGEFGAVNPMAAMSDAIGRLYRVATPSTPKTTYSASVTGGGTSVNTIPGSAFVDIDMRSSDPASLAKLETRWLAIVGEAVAAENSARSTKNGEIKADPKLIGDRPAGGTAAESPLVRTALASGRALGFEPYLEASSTDSNIPMSLGIPSLTIGSGAGGDRTHTVDEYLEVEREAFVRGLSAGLALIMATAGT